MPKWSNPDNPYAPDWLPDPIPGFEPFVRDPSQLKGYDPTTNPFYGGQIQRDMHEDPVAHAKSIEPFSRPKTDDWKEQARQWQIEHWAKNRDKRVRKVFAEGVVYKDALEAAEHYGINPVNIRRKCRLERKGFRYI